MGAINNIFSQNKNYFSKIEEILKMLIKQNKNRSQNITVLHEIGLLKEYSYIKSDNCSNELINFSKNNKSIKKLETSSKLKEKFIEWTKFLFDINDEENLSEEQLNQKIKLLKQKALKKEYFQQNIKKYIFKNKSFNKLLYYGIPNNFREFIWDIAISERYANHKYYNCEEEQKAYFDMLKNTKNIEPQIEKDLNRTFFNEFERTQKNIKLLRNVLNCINKYNNGYCQGMNFIVRFLLKVTNFDEVETFYIFKNILKDIKGYFEDGFPLLKKNLFKFDIYFQALYPKLYKHFKKNEIYNEMWVGKWFQTLFTISMPFAELSNVWDNLIIKGFDFIIFISLAIIDSIEKDLFELKDSSDILNYLDNIINPKEISITNKKLFIEEKDYIIPLKEIISKAYKIEKEIKEKKEIKENNEYLLSNNIYNKSNLMLQKDKINHNDFESVCTKESDNSMTVNNSSFSSNFGHLKLLKSSNLANTHSNNIYKLKNNLRNTKFGRNKINNNDFIKKSQTTFYSSKTTKILNPTNNENKINVNKNKASSSNTRDYNVAIYPLQATKYIFYPNNFNSNINNHRRDYTNYLTYYA